MKARIAQDFGEEIVLIGELPMMDRETFLRYISPDSKELEMGLDTDIFITGNDWEDGLYELKRPELPLLRLEDAKSSRRWRLAYCIPREPRFRSQFLPFRTG